jgi:hypothetical protein
MLDGVWSFFGITLSGENEVDKEIQRVRKVAVHLQKVLK